ncbi:lipopolysaccharide-induced tumor necrosis factor-alpha factor homolog [Diretmus argenteus]
MDPPSYEEANLHHPPPLGTVVLNISPPPAYEASLALPSTPPPSYGEAVGIIERRPTQTVVVVQPQQQQQPITTLRDAPAVIQCPYCRQVVTTNITLVCGCCLIPFMVHGMQDVYHSCPQCKKHLHIYTR